MAPPPELEAQPPLSAGADPPSPTKAEKEGGATAPPAKRPRRAGEKEGGDDERVPRAALTLAKSPALTVSQAMACSDFTQEECADRALQQRVRRLHAKLDLDQGGGSGGTTLDAATRRDMEAEHARHAAFASRAGEFIDASTDPFLAVRTCSEVLDEAGFVKLSKREPFGGRLRPGGSYYYTVNHSTLVAFTVGGKYEAGNGFKIIGGHTDSPHLKVKPLSKRSGAGCVQLGVECYGGGLWHTWFDRDLGISGRVLVRTVDPETQKETIEQHMIKIDQPVARVSSLAIHLETAEERSAFKVNKEEHLSPIIGTSKLLEAAASKQLMQGGDDDGDDWKEGQEPALMRLIASELGVDAKRICNFELGLFDTQRASVGGIKGEFLNSARLDNLATVFVALEAMVDYGRGADAAEDDMISLIACFDHEEIGSTSSQGAGSPVMAEAVSRITSAFGENAHARDPETHSSAVRRSFILSVDQAHAVHPNYLSKHERNHGPRMNAGIVIKTNQNQRYATNGVTGFVARELARRSAGPSRVPVQEFCVRSDCPCGSTIGPMLSASTGIRVVDLGMPQLSMHSCREVMGIADLTHCLNLFKSFFKNFNELDESLEG